MENTTTILRVLVGSRAHGLETPDSDFDYRGVFVVPTSEILKLGGSPQTTNWIEGKEDNTSWELGHFLNLATHCNPTILETFLAPTDSHWAFENRDDRHIQELQNELKDLFPHIWNSVDVYNAFRGYSKNQQKKFLDKKDTRPHKYASAYLRALYQGIQLLETGIFSVNFRETPIHETLCSWKNKKYTIGEVMDLTNEYEEKFAKAFEKNPDHQANLEPVNEFLLRVRREFWE